MHIFAFLHYLRHILKNARRCGSYKSQSFKNCLFLNFSKYTISGSCSSYVDQLFSIVSTLNSYICITETYNSPRAYPCARWVVFYENYLKYDRQYYMRNIIHIRQAILYESIHLRFASCSILFCIMSIIVTLTTTPVAWVFYFFIKPAN